MAVTQPLDDKVRDALLRPMTVVDISTTGRRSGQERRIEIVMHNIGGRLYISGQPSRRRRGWLANLGDESDVHPASQAWRAGRSPCHGT
jgi:hypothetical protein